MKKTIILLLLLGFIAACALGPDYHRPDTHTPGAYRGLTASDADQTGVAALGDQKWWEVYPDPQLQALIHTALAENYDVRIAASRILQAVEQENLVIADELPFVTGNASMLRQRTPELAAAPSKSNSSSTGSSSSSGGATSSGNTASHAATASVPLKSTMDQVNIAFAWDMSFWWKYRRATEAARANLLASVWGQRAVMGTLVSNLAAAYFQLRELDLELDISKRTLASRQDSLRLTQTLANHGATSLLDVRQAEQLVYTASEQIPDLERRIEQQENLISILVGHNPGDVVLGDKLTDEAHAPQVPVGLPSALLERRPDVQQAEQALILQNANIGLAKAEYFPQITLTAMDGFQSSQLTDLFKNSGKFWNAGVAVSQPIFESGRIWFGVKLAEAQQQEALLTYQKTVQQAFREVSDALVAYRRDQEFTTQQKLLTQAAQGASDLSNMRYKGGATSYLEVLTNETNYFTAELGLARAQLNELLALVELYRALGGGWQQSFKS